MVPDRDQPMCARDQYERGRDLKQILMYDKALAAFQQAATDPQYAGMAHLQMALCYRATNRHAEAVASFRTALMLGTFTAKEKAQILSSMGQTLELLGQYADALEIYGWARKENPGLQDVTDRIKHLSSGGRDPVPRRRPASQSVVGGFLKLGQHLTPHVLGLFGQASKSGGENAARPEPMREDRQPSQSVRDRGHSNGPQAVTPTRCSSPTSWDGKRDKRQHVRVAIRAHGHFSSKGQIVIGEGELRDLSAGGCRVKSVVDVPVGVELEFCILPEDRGNPFTVEGAKVCWSHSQEFGLAFTTVRPGVQRRIAQLCGTQTPFGVDV